MVAAAQRYVSELTNIFCGNNFHTMLSLKINQVLYISHKGTVVQ